MSQPTNLLGPLDGLSADDINRRFQKLMAEADLGLIPALDDGAFVRIVDELAGRPRLFTFVDLFCGAGGSSTGLTMAGGQLLFAANHSKRNIETHSANFSYAEHRTADLNHYDMRNIPAGADVLWASPICTETSPAGGNAVPKQRQPATAGQRELMKFGPVAAEEFERTRATFGDVIRATEVHMFKYVVVENVVEAAWKWKLFGWWLDGMELLGYGYRIVSVSAAHVGDALNPHAAQRRNRMYVVFHRLDMPKPDVTPRPVSRCDTCGIVEGVQWWKKPKGTLTRSGRLFKVGKYGRQGQYLYRCPNFQCQNSIVVPFERPATTIIDWTDIGVRICDRPADDPLAPNTIRRVEWGMRLFGRPAIVNSNHDDDRVVPADSHPMPAATTKIGNGLACPPFLDANGGSWNVDPAPVTAPFRARTSSEWEGLVVPDDGAVPFIVKNNSDGGRPQDRVSGITVPFGSMTTGRNQSLIIPPDAFIETKRNNVVPTSVDDPFTTVAAGGNHHALVIPYDRTGRPRTTESALPTQTTVDRCGLASPDAVATLDVMQARYRMIQWYEQARAQRFPASYLFTGNAGERTAGAGNAVAGNVACWIGQAIAVALNRTAASV